MKYLDKKPMFFDMGKPSVDPFDALRAEPAPSGYYTSAPASLPGGPPACDHKTVNLMSIDHADAVKRYRCRDCGKEWTFSMVDLATMRGTPKFT